MRRALCFFVGFQLTCLAVLAQDSIKDLHKMCFTTDIAENHREPQDFFYPTPNRNGFRNASWNLNQGYGPTCTNDCIMTTAASCSKFRIPVVFTVSTQPGCGISIPTQANIDAQIAITNDFYACQNVPIEFYKSTTYSGHPTTGDMSTRYQNIGCTYSPSVLNDIPNVLNIYIFSNTSYGTFANGWAYLPSGTTAPLRVIMSRAAFNTFSYTPGTLSCAAPNLGLSIILIHELGHIFGLHHTHNELNATKECPDMSNSCTGGDYIADTDADPGLHLACASGSGCNLAPNGCTSPCATPYPTDINTENNIMSYNNVSNCRTTFTTCQKAKLMDGLLCARGPQMCDRNVNLEFTNGSEDTYYEICVGDPPPTFTATSACFAWYATLGVATPLYSNTSSFTPSIGSGAGQLNNNVPDVYHWYLGDLNEINPNCRTLLTIKVISDVGIPTVNSSTSFVSSSCTMSDIANLTTNTTALGANEIIGWWITQGSPITDVVTDESSLNTALSTATINGPLSNPVNHLIQSTSGSPLKNLPLSFDCGPLDEGVNYFATPVLAHYASAVPDVVLNCTTNPSMCGAATGFNFGCGYLSGGSFNTGAITGIPSNPPNAPTYTIQISNIIYPSTCTPGQMLLDIRNPSTQSNIYLGLPGAVSTITLNQNNFPGYNPANGFWIMLYDQATGTCCTMNQAVVNFNVTISITYPGLPAVSFPSFTGYNPCYFGESVALNCACSCLPQANITADKSILCPNESTILNASPSGIYNYIWNDNSTNATLLISPTMTSTYTVTVTHSVVNCSSTSSKEIFVETGQNVFSTMNQGAGTLRHILECATDGDIITFDPGLTLDLTDSLEINKNIELVGDPTNSTNINIVSNSNQFGWKLTAGKTLDLYDIILNITTSGAPALINQGTINLNHSEILGNHDPVVQNLGEVNVIGNATSKIKKN